MTKSAQPAPPTHLSEEACDWWLRLHKEYGIADEAGLLLLQTAMEAFDRMREAQADIRRDGATVKDRFDQLRQHPAIPTEQTARAQLLASLKALNLDLEPLAPAPGRQPGVKGIDF